MTGKQLPDLRFDVPLYTLTEASRYLLVSRATLATWADGYERRPANAPTVKGQPIITALPHRAGSYARLPFVGIAEAYVLNAFRRAGVPMQRIRPSLDWLIKNVGPHALASQDLCTDGAEVLWRFAERSGEGSPDDQVVRGLIVPRSGQYVFKEIVEHYLKQISFADDRLASMIRLPQYGEANVVLDPCRGYGQPLFDGSGVRVADVLGPLRAGATFRAVADDYGVTVAQLQDAVDAIAA
ncbi:hypothetical protein A4G26_10100 [Mycobacterium kansasii]|uniref:Antitoxin VapB45 n=1 Tax=Mycobacterium innocens TaxID=2341083 RepID=A0A498Q8T2_9MYCO|nr:MULTISPECIES: DUF433 domain-containing protein [Mycobacterium]KZS64409.1 hypothetical protein A4G26_10100 [Mycobacterium kansasii]VBA41767.1 Putative antitoxin VapB45 [Mycobacterium innocens]